MKISNEDKKFLALYSDSEYEKPSVTVDAVIFRILSQESENYRKLPEKKLQVFLNKRNFPPFKNKFSIIGTFIDLKYELTESMKLCVKNKVDLNNYYYEQLFTFGEKSRDPRTRVLSVSYMLLTNSEENLINGEWFDIDVKEIDSNIESLENGYKINKTYSILLTNEHHKIENIIVNTLKIRNFFDIILIIANFAALVKSQLQTFLIKSKFCEIFPTGIGDIGYLFLL